MLVRSLDRASVNEAMAAVPRHTWGRSIAWHLLPGVPLAVAYAALAYIFTQRLSLPNVFALFAVVTFVEIPLLYYLVRRFRSGGESLRTSMAAFPLRLRQPPWVWLVIAVPVTLFSFVANAAIAGRIDIVVRQSMFAFLPDWFVLDFSQAGMMAVRDTTPGVFYVFYTMSLVGFIGGSYLQELYFRGVLLPRMPEAGVGTPLANAVLFSIFHLTSPWAIFGRLLFLVPWSLIVWWRKSLNLGIVMHVGMAVIGAAMGAVFMFSR